MKTPDLDAVGHQIEQAASEAGLALFRGQRRTEDPLPWIDWDTDRYPDATGFVKAAKQLGVSLLVFHQRQFSADAIESALDSLRETEMPPEEVREMERRLAQLANYEGFTCAIELSFDYENNTYMFDLQAPWYEEFTDILDELGGGGDLDDDEDETPPLGLFSRN